MQPELTWMWGAGRKGARAQKTGVWALKGGRSTRDPPAYLAWLHSPIRRCWFSKSGTGGRGLCGPSAGDTTERQLGAQGTLPSAADTPFQLLIRPELLPTPHCQEATDEGLLSLLVTAPSSAQEPEGLRRGLGGRGGP